MRASSAVFRFRRAQGLLALALLLWAGAALARQPAYTGIDLLFLVDQSGSMGGRAFNFPVGGEGTDPLGLRFEAVQYAMDTLGQYRLTLAPETAIRAAVINFGDAPRDTDLSAGWHDIAPSGDLAEWEAQRGPLLASLSADTFANRNLGNTNFTAAFEAAHTLFSRLPGDENHLRVVILLTDGAPCAPALFDCNSFQAQQEHMQALFEQTQRDFPPPDYRIYVIALDSSGSLWERWQNAWQQVAGAAERVGRVETAQQVGVRFLTILNELLPDVRGIANQSFVALTPGSNTVSVPPYIQEMRVSIFKSTASPGVLGVTRPDGTLLAAIDPSLEIQNQDRPIEVWSIRQPAPGNWRFDVGSTGDRIDVYLELIPVQAEAAVTGGSFIQNDDVTLEVRLRDAAGAPLVIYEAPYDLTVQASITAPDGSTRNLPLARLPDNTFYATLTAEQIGVYTVGVNATTQTSDGRLLPILEAASLSAFEVTGVRFQATAMPSGQYLVGDQVEVAAVLTDENGAPLTLENTAVTAEVAQTGLTTTYTLAAGAGGEYRLALNLGEAGDFTLTLRAASTRLDGRTLTLGQPISARFSVLPSQPVRLALISPQTATSQQYLTEGMPPLTPTDLQVIFEAQVEGVPVDVESLSADLAALWRVRLLKDDLPLADLDAPVRPLPGEVGRYRVRIPNLDGGRYTVEISAGGRLTGNYILDPAASSLTLTIERVTNPLYLVTLAVTGLALVAFVAAAAFVMRRGQLRRRHPARGTLVIREQDSGKVLLDIALEHYRSNTITIASRRLRKAGLTRLRITCPDEKMSQAGRVRVSAETASGYLFRDRLLAPGDTLPLKKGSLFDVGGEDGAPVYELAKDPHADSILL